jgi:hypothetical protein
MTIAITPSTSRRTCCSRTFPRGGRSRSGPATSPMSGCAKVGSIWRSSSIYSQQRVVSWAISNRLKQDLAIRVLNMAIALRRPQSGCIHHTNRGSPYCRPRIIANLSGRPEEPDRSTLHIGESMQFGIHATFCSADLTTAPSFLVRRPDAVRCALKEVVSIMIVSAPDPRQLGPS